MASVHVNANDACVFIDLQDDSLCQIANTILESVGVRSVCANEINHDKSICNSNCLIGKVIDRVGLSEVASCLETSRFSTPILCLHDVDRLAASTVIELACHGWKFLCPTSNIEELEPAFMSLITEGDFLRKQRRQIERSIALRSTLSESEEEVMQLMINGTLNKQIAGRLNVSIRTVEQRRRQVFEKMGVVNAVELARKLGEVDALTRIDRSHQIYGLNETKFYSV